MKKTSRFSPLRFLLQWGIEFGPSLVFIIAYQFSGFITGVLLNLLATLLAVLVAQLYQRRIALFPIAMLIFVSFFGSLTWFYQDPQFFIYQHSIYYSLFSLILIFSWIKKSNTLKRLFLELFAISDSAWRSLDLRWGILFLFLAFSNEFVWRILGESQWVIFKFSTNIIILLFGLYQFRLSRKERLPEANALGLRVSKRR